MIIYFVFLVAGVSCFKNESVNLVCDDPKTYPCANGECIYRYMWCDKVEDCSDGSDERFCHGDSETEVEVTNVLKSANKIALTAGKETEQAVAHAAQYLLGKMTGDGWGNFTPRAAVALSFVDKVVPMNTSEKGLMKMHLNVHLMLKFVQAKPSSTSLASYINALFATCQDPRNFQGVDLVALLRSEADNASMSNLEYYPVAFLSLCLADEVNGDDLQKLAEMYLKSNRTGFRALAIMAMICVGRKINRKVDRYVDHFFTQNEGIIENADIYTKALYLQAAIATGFNVERELGKCRLDGYQLPDGSFGDMLATYNAIPVLLHTSLLDLRCNLAKSEELIAGKKLNSAAGNKLIYSLWITTDKGINTRSMIMFDGNGTFYDIMRMAASTDPSYRFLYDETPNGKKIYALAGIPNDVETGLSWILYEGEVDSVTVNSEKYLNKITLGVDKVIPRNKNHFVFWYTR